MHHVHVLGSASPLFDHLWRWRDRVAIFEQSTIYDLPSAIERIRSTRPEWVVYCGAAAASSWEDVPFNSDDEARRMAQVAQAVAEMDARLLIVSSDRVFAGPRMFHDETESVSDDPQAHSLHSIEQAALSLDGVAQRVLVARTNAFGWSVSGDSFAERIWHTLDEGRVIELNAAMFATPILASDLAEVLLRCLRSRLSGIVHLGGAERTSPFRFGQELAVAAGFDPRLVKAGSAEAEDEHAAKCLEMSLGTRLVRREFDIALPLLRESLASFADQATNGYRQQLRTPTEGAVARAA